MYKGITVLSLLTVLFVVLKVTGTVGWAWLWVLSPIWIGLGWCIFVILLVLAYTIRDMYRL